MPRWSASRTSVSSRRATAGLELAVAGEAVEGRVRVGPAAVAALDVDADQVDPVGGHVVEVADVPLGDRLAAQGVAAPQSPEIDLLAAQPRADRRGSRTRGSPPVRRPKGSDRTS